MKFHLVRTQTEIPGVESFIFEPSEPLSWKAGQYAHYRLPHESADDRGIERWFTIASAPFETQVMLTTRFTPEQGSTFKTALRALRVGDSIESDYVDGDFIIEDTAQEYVCIAGGIGITPFHSILKEADHAGVKLRATLIYANRDAHVAFKSELDAWARNNQNLDIHYVTSPDRIDAAAIQTFVSNVHVPLFYLSGPEPMVKSLGALLEGMGVSTDRIKLDDFPGYPAE